MKSKRQSKRCIMSCVGCVNNWHATDILLYYNVAKNFMKSPDSNHYYYTPTFSRDNLFQNHNPPQAFKYTALHQNGAMEIFSCQIASNQWSHR